MTNREEPESRTPLASVASARLNRRQAFKLVAAAGAGAAALPAAFNTFEALAAADPATLVIGRNIDDVITLDPATAGEETYTVVFRSAYDTLVSTDPANPGAIVPALAESWEVAPDASKVTLKLKQGLVFASGNPITSADVKFSFDRLKNIKSQDSYLMDGVASVDAPDANTIAITLSSPNAAFLSSLTSVTFSVTDSAVVKANGGVSEPGADSTDKATTWLNQNSAGSGPYIMTGYSPKDRISFKRNDKAAVRKAVIDNVILQSRSGHQRAQADAGKRRRRSRLGSPHRAA